MKHTFIVLLILVSCMISLSYSEKLEDKMLDILRISGDTVVSKDTEYSDVIIYVEPEASFSIAEGVSITLTRAGIVNNGKLVMSKNSIITTRMSDGGTFGIYSSNRFDMRNATIKDVQFISLSKEMLSHIVDNDTLSKCEKAIMKKYAKSISFISAEIVSIRDSVLKNIQQPDWWAIVNATNVSISETIIEGCNTTVLVNCDTITMSNCRNTNIECLGIIFARENADIRDTIFDDIHIGASKPFELSYRAFRSERIVMVNVCMKFLSVEGGYGEEIYLICFDFYADGLLVAKNTKIDCSAVDAKVFIRLPTSYSMLKCHIMYSNKGGNVLCRTPGESYFMKNSEDYVVFEGQYDKKYQ